MYELALILQSANKTDEEVKKEFDQLRRSLESTFKENLTFTAIHHWGRRKFVYPIKKQEYGYYLISSVECTPSCHAQLQKELRLSDLVVRFVLFELAEGASSKPQLDTPE